MLLRESNEKAARVSPPLRGQDGGDVSERAEQRILEGCLTHKSRACLERSFLL